MGFKLLQWPHQGAWNLTNTVFPETAASQVSAVSDIVLAVESKLNANNFAIFLPRVRER